MKKIPPARPVGWETFGAFIFSQREADPGYYIVDYLRDLERCPPDQLKRFVVAWCTFYNLGIAAKASELKGAHFYKYLMQIYPEAKRASERRHFRGAAGLRAITDWRAKWPKPEGLADHITGPFRYVDTGWSNPTMGEIRNRCKSVMQMGDYFKWKWGDLTEVLTQKPVRFTEWVKYSPKVPLEGARLIEQDEGWPEDTVATYGKIVDAMRGRKIRSAYAPWRPFDVQDAETVCCVYKQYRSGGYTPGLRTAKAFARLYKDGENCDTAKAAIKHLLEKQPQPLFQDPQQLASILNGDTILRVERLL